MSVVIAGAGPTGLTLAIDLARRDVPVRVVEKQSSYFPGSRGKGIQPRTLEVFEDLGVVDAILAASGPYPRMRAYSGATLLREWDQFERYETTPAVPYANIRMIPQARTESILRDRLASYGVRVELGTELTGFSQDAAGVTVTLTTPSGVEETRAAYLVGADGGRSFVRKTLGIAFDGYTKDDELMLAGDVTVPGIDHEFWHVWPQAEGGTVLLCPMPGTESFQFIAMNPEPGATVAGVLTSRLGLTAGNVTWESVHRTNVRLAARYQEGRVLLAGDAAHVHPPAGGQGLNTGVQDAYNLGWKLAAVLGGADPALLETYEAERRPIAEGVLGLSERLRGDAEARRDSETHQLHLGYRGGPLAPPGTGPLQPGDRAPDAPVGGGRLFELFRGPRWTLLAFGDAPLADLGPAVRTFAVDDVDGHAREAYGLTGSCLVLVRPDGHVGLITADIDPAEKYLAGLSL
ncbi:FAD-dependent monooxygenase [Longispora albida]|uniref:FAD-dependent monooxygenase n=1 Tax=Longispora albida TaxID=203523 RepID=UPI0003663B42|nr:FAD-dependent monooxygenase [Longispora albida]